jgi:hypothetical protein
MSPGSRSDPGVWAIVKPFRGVDVARARYLDALFAGSDAAAMTSTMFMRSRRPSLRQSVKKNGRSSSGGTYSLAWRKMARSVPGLN